MLDVCLTIPGEPLIVRSFTADIRLRHESVAKRHACLRLEESGACIQDLGAADPVRRNGVVISSSAPARTGDTFHVGECELTIVRADSTVEDPMHEHPSRTSD